MTAKSFEAQVRHQPRVAIIDLHGEINAFAEDVLNKAYAEAESRRAEVILLNFSDVDYINSTGIALIVSLLARSRKSKRRLLACGLSDHYVEIFQITRLVDFMSVFPDEKSALAEEGRASITSSPEEGGTLYAASQCNDECSPGQSNNQDHRYSWRCLGIRGKCTDGGLCRGQYSNHSHHHLKFCGAGVYEQ